MVSGGVVAYNRFSNLDDNSIESREKILNQSLKRGKNWTLWNEVIMNNYQYIISGAYSTNGKAAIVVFEQKNNGNYKLSTSATRDKDEIIISGTIINGDWYDFILFNGAQTEYAEVIYTINGIKQDPLRFDTDIMELITIKNNELVK